MKKIITIISIASIFIIGCTPPEAKRESAIKKFIDKISGEPVVPRNANKIYIEDFDNRSGNSSIAYKLELLLKKLISMDGRLAVVRDISIADILLKGSITSYQVQAVKFGNIGRPVEKRMRIVAGVKLYDRIRKKIIFQEPGIQSFETYSDVIPPVKSDNQVLNIVLENLSKRIFSKIITGWYTEHLTNIEKGKKP